MSRTKVRIRTVFGSNIVLILQKISSDDEGWIKASNQSFIFNERIEIIASYSYEIDFNATYYKQGIRI